MWQDSIEKYEDFWYNNTMTESGDEFEYTSFKICC